MMRNAFRQPASSSGLVAAVRTLRRLAAPMAIVVVAAMALSGCGVEVVGVTSSPTQPADVPSSATASTSVVVDVDPSATPEQSATSATPEPPVAPVGPATETELARRSYYEGKIEVSTGCPGGKVVLDQTMRVTKITEDCKEVVVTGPFTTLLADRIDTLTIESSASHGHFLIGSIGKATVAAPFNHVYWDAGDPVLKVTGFKCVVRSNPVKESK